MNSFLLKFGKIKILSFLLIIKPKSREHNTLNISKKMYIIKLDQQSSFNN
jgi:hypothetical protein